MLGETCVGVGSACLSVMLVSSSAAVEMSSAEVWKSLLTSSIVLASISAEFLLHSVAARSSSMATSMDAASFVAVATVC